jgi:hypothetical protein
MNYMRATLFVTLLLLVCGALATAQITNLTVCGAASNFTVVSGGTLTWQYDIPSGSTTQIEIWYDVNNNGTIDPGTDIEVEAAGQTDGDIYGFTGIPDADGVVNGQASFSNQIGISAGAYILKFTNGSSVVTISGTVTALPSPAHTVSGTITPPPGHSKQGIEVQLSANGFHYGSAETWSAFTDADGNFTISMDADTTGNPWELDLGALPGLSFGAYLVSPQVMDITIANAAYTGEDFSFVKGAAQVAGYIKDQNNNPVPNAYMLLAPVNGYTSYDYFGSTSATGFFQIGLLAADLSDTTVWTVEQSNSRGFGPAPPMMTAYANVGVVANGDSIGLSLLSFANNSTITGRVILEGISPGAGVTLLAITQNDSGVSYAETDTGGNFSIPVSNKIGDYTITIPFFAGFSNLETPAHAGESGLIINLEALGEPEPIAYSMSDKWNLISIPQYPTDASVATLFPSAQSRAFAYQGSYVAAPTIFPGVGYWLKFSGAQTDTINAPWATTNTIQLTAGWNLFGAVAEPVLVSSIIQTPDSIAVTKFFGYNNGYAAADTLYPGQGYWVKTSAAGSFFFSGTDAAKKQQAKKAALKATALSRNKQFGKRLTARSSTRKNILGF